MMAFSTVIFLILGTILVLQYTEAIDTEVHNLLKRDVDPIMRSFATLHRVKRHTCDNGYSHCHCIGGRKRRSPAKKVASRHCCCKVIKNESTTMNTIDKK